MDIFDDSNLSLFKVLDNEYDIPLSVKHASIAPGELNRNKKKIFADNVNKKFAMDTEEDMYLSALYLTKYAGADKENIVATLNRFSEYTGNPVCLVKKANVTAGTDPSKYAVHLPDGLKMYPLHTEQLVKLANEHFPNKLDGDLEYLRPQVAQKIASMSTKISPMVERYLPIKSKHANKDIDTRYTLTKDSNYIGFKEIIYSGLLNNARSCELFSTKLAHLDEKHGIQKYYGTDILDPSEYNRMVEADPMEYKSDNIDYSKIYSKRAKVASTFPRIQDILHDPVQLEMWLSLSDPYTKEVFNCIIQ